MPTYEYGCTACGHQWEQVQRIVDAPIEVCPKCAASSAHRLISAGTNFILKGGGWYSDLYSSAKGPAKASEPAAKPEPAKADGAAKSEPTAKSEPAASSASPPASPTSSSTSS